ncbi:hypothetical protein L6452_43744 [Arctium lappa]|uniref:Uncharacterized protein n=1 Tax=Arctium lappa TaxID=4217 RepID=A0ACB8XEW9_ARCLA|nr:hypothetical protein L6452_43744 [Arctium lappa]
MLRYSFSRFKNTASTPIVIDYDDETPDEKQNEVEANDNRIGEDEPDIQETDRKESGLPEQSPKKSSPAKGRQLEVQEKKEEDEESNSFATNNQHPFSKTYLMGPEVQQSHKNLENIEGGDQCDMVKETEVFGLHANGPSNVSVGPEDLVGLGKLSGQIKGILEGRKNNGPDNFLGLSSSVPIRRIDSIEDMDPGEARVVVNRLKNNVDKRKKDSVGIQVGAGNCDSIKLSKGSKERDSSLGGETMKARMIDNLGLDKGL